MENLEEIHEDSLKPQSNEDLANSLDLSGSSKKLAEDNTKEVILTALKIHGVDHDTLNVSKSKFAKLNKLQLIESLKAHLNGSNEAKEDPKEADTKEIDIIGEVMELQKLISDAMTSDKEDRYKKLDSKIAKNMIESLGSSGAIDNANVNPSDFAKLLLVVGSIYFLSRLIGFDRIGRKALEIKEKILNKQEVKSEK